MSYCVENKCSFRDHIRGYVCPTHSSRHVCSASSCSLIRSMATRTQYQAHSSESPCPVAALLVFQKPQLEFRGTYYVPAKGDPVEMGYGAMEHEPGTRLCDGELDVNHLILKASLPVMIALFSTALTDKFARQYETIAKSQVLNNSWKDPRFSWPTKIFELAEAIQFAGKPTLHCSREMSSVVKEAVLKSAVALSTLFNSRDDKITRFMRKVTCKYNDKHSKRADFNTMVVMLTLCLFPYLKHRVLCDLFNNRTLVIMCFDKTRTRHNQWSTLSTHVHLHANQPEFVKGVLANSDLGSSLPIVVTVTLDKYMSDASYSGNTIESMSHSHSWSPQDHSKQMKKPRKARNRPQHRPESLSFHQTKTSAPLTGKRKTPCYAGYYERHEGRLEEKVMHLEHS